MAVSRYIIILFRSNKFIILLLKILPLNYGLIRAFSVYGEESFLFIFLLAERGYSRLQEIAFGGRK